MKTSNISILSVPMLLAGAIALSGCGQRSAANPTTISYRQVGICKSYATLTAKPDEGFAVFKIEAIDNAKQNAPFNLDPERIYVDQTPAAMQQKSQSFQTRRFTNLDPRFGQAMGVASLAQTAIPANEKRDINTFIVVPVGLNNPAGGPEANQYSFDLVFDTTTAHEQIQSAASGVVLAKTNPADTKYTVIENCKELAFK